MSEPARAEPERLRAPLEVRVGSVTNALQPVPGAQRSLGAGASQWAELAVVAVVAAAADQLTKSIVSSQLALGDAVDILGPFSIHHVRNTGIAFGLFSGATSIVIVLTACAIAALLTFFARSARRHPLLPVAVGLAPLVIRFLPNLLIAVFVLLVGWLIANFLAQTLLIFVVNAQLSGGPLLAGAVRWLVWAFAGGDGASANVRAIARAMIRPWHVLVMNGGSPARDAPGPAGMPSTPSARSRQPFELSRSRAAAQLHPGPGDRPRRPVPCGDTANDRRAGPGTPPGSGGRPGRAHRRCGNSRRSRCSRGGQPRASTAPGRSGGRRGTRHATNRCCR